MQRNISVNLKSSCNHCVVANLSLKIGSGITISIFYSSAARNCSSPYFAIAGHPVRAHINISGYACDCHKAKTLKVKCLKKSVFF